MPSNIYGAANNYTADGADRLARTVERKWRQKYGIAVKVWTEPHKLSDDVEVYLVKSDLVNGLPASAEDRAKYFASLANRYQPQKIAA